MKISFFVNRSSKMCIIFCLCGSLTASFRFILAANRDEYFYRPATPASFWHDSPHVLAGQDMTKGKEGGVWLGMTKSGHIGALTNLHKQQDGNVCFQSRGPLLRNFLVEEQDPMDYACELNKTKERYDGFNLLLGRVSPVSNMKIVFINNANENIMQEIKGIHCISNGGLDNNWAKVVNGTAEFEAIVTSQKDKDTLISELLKLLQNETRYEDSCNGPGAHISCPEVRSSLSSIFVKACDINYGTRTNTVILIDNEYHVTFVERTMVDPMNITNPKWETAKFEFYLNNGQDIP